MRALCVGCGWCSASGSRNFEQFPPLTEIRPEGDTEEKENEPKEKKYVISARMKDVVAGMKEELASCLQSGHGVGRCAYHASQLDEVLEVMDRLKLSIRQFALHPPQYLRLLLEG